MNEEAQHPRFSAVRDHLIRWRRTGNGEFPYEAEHEGRILTIRVNDFPAEPLYTLLVDGADELEDLEDWPPHWIRPT